MVVLAIEIAGSNETAASQTGPAREAAILCVEPPSCAVSVGKFFFDGAGTGSKYLWAAAPIPVRHRASIMQYFADSRRPRRFKRLRGREIDQISRRTGIFAFQRARHLTGLAGVIHLIAVAD